MCTAITRGRPLSELPARRAGPGIVTGGCAAGANPLFQVLISEYDVILVISCSGPRAAWTPVDVCGNWRTMVIVQVLFTCRWTFARIFNRHISIFRSAIFRGGF